MSGVPDTGPSNTATPAALGAVAPLSRFLRDLDALVTFPVALALALVGQFALGGLIMAASPPAEIGAGAPEASTWPLVLLLLLQGAALVFAVHRRGARPSRVYLALAALTWAIASLLLVYVAFQCDLGGICL